MTQVTTFHLLRSAFHINPHMYSTSDNEWPSSGTQGQSSVFWEYLSASQGVHWHRMCPHCKGNTTILEQAAYINSLPTQPFVRVPFTSSL